MCFLQLALTLLLQSTVSLNTYSNYKCCRNIPLLCGMLNRNWHQLLFSACLTNVIHCPLACSISSAIQVEPLFNLPFAPVHTLCFLQYEDARLEQRLWNVRACSVQR